MNIQFVKGVGPKKAQRLNKLNIYEIKDLLKKRCNIKSNLCQIWKDQMNFLFDELINQYNNSTILLIGFNIYPKDYRIKINLPVKELPQTNKNKIICDLTPEQFASNQIKYYLSNLKTIQKQLLVVHQFALEHLNSGTIVKELQSISKKIRKRKEKIKKTENIEVLVSIVVDIALLNPRTYSIAMTILSILFGLIENDLLESIVTKIINKFNSIPNTGHMQIWLQRAIAKLPITQKDFHEPLCKLVNNESISLWNNEWLHAKNTKILENRNNIIDQNILDTLDAEIQDNEVLLFGEQSL